MKFFKNIFKRNTSKETIENKKEIEIIDHREGEKTPLDQIEVRGEDDPVMKAVLNAAIHNENGVSGTFEDGKLTIKDS